MTQKLWQRWQQHKDPFRPASYDKQIVMAVRAFKAGEATESQQQLLWQWMEYVTGTGDWQDLSFRSDEHGGDRATTFALGKQFVGLEFRKMTGQAAYEAAVVEKPAPTNKREARRKR